MITSEVLKLRRRLGQEGDRTKLDLVRKRTRKLGLGLAAGLLLVPVAANGACPIVDLETPLEQLAARTANQPAKTRLQAYREQILAPYAQAYAPEVLGPFTEEQLDTALKRSLDQAEDYHRPRLLGEIRSSLAGAEREFGRTFPKFRCDFSIYLMDTLGRFDGAGRVVAGRPSLVLGIDQLAAERDVLPLRVFLNHELFHRYHRQVAGFSDDPGEHQAIWRSLWAEGLATYVSYRLAPGASIADALILPRDLAVQAAPRLRSLSDELLTHLDEQNPAVYRPYFTYGGAEGPSRGIPWRAGYYLGFLVARDLGRTRSLAELSELKGKPLRNAIAASLRQLSGSRGN